MKPTCAVCGRYMNRPIYITDKKVCVCGNRCMDKAINLLNAVCSHCGKECDLSSLHEKTTNTYSCKPCGKKLREESYKMLMPNVRCAECGRKNCAHLDKIKPLLALRILRGELPKM